MRSTNKVAPGGPPSVAEPADEILSAQQSPGVASAAGNGGGRRSLDRRRPTSQLSQPNTQNSMGSGDQLQGVSLLPEFQKERKKAVDEQVARCFMPDGFYIFHPYSTPRLSWDMWVVALLVYTSLMVPYSLAFQDAVCGDDDNDVGAKVLLWMVDACFWADILLNFRTAIMDPNADNLTQMQLVSDWKVITWAYLKGWFLMDVMGSFPVQVVEQALSQPGECSLTALKALRLNRLARMARLLKLLRLARLARWNRLVTKAKDALSINPGHIRLGQFVIFVFVLAHMLSCVLYGIIEWEEGYETKWATGVTFVVPGSGIVVLACPQVQFRVDSDEVDPESPTQYATDPNTGQATTQRMCRQEGGDFVMEADPSIKYLISLYVTFTTLTTVGYGDITMRTTPELIFGIVMMALGASTFAVVVGNMAALLGKMDLRATAFKERMEDLDDFMHQENLPLDLRFRTRAFFEYGYNHSRDIPASIEELSMSLRTEVALHLYNDLITTVPFFRDCGKEFLTEVILRLNAQTLSPGDYLYEAGEYGESMYFLIKGSVEVVLDDKNGVFAELKEGSYIGENCVLGLSTQRPVSVRAMSWCNLFCLTAEALEDCIAHHPEAQRHFIQLAQMPTAEKTVSLAVNRLEGLRNGTIPPDALEDEETREQLAADALGNHGRADNPFWGQQPPVVTRALRRQHNGQFRRARPQREDYALNAEKMAMGQLDENARQSLQGGVSASLARTSGRGSQRPVKHCYAEDEEEAVVDNFANSIIESISEQQKKAQHRRERLGKGLDDLHEQLRALLKNRQ